MSSGEGQLEPINLAYDPLVQVGMKEADRLDLLTRPPEVIPPRQISVNEANDPFGLLEHEDTYEVLAGIIYKECEGIFRYHVVNNRDVARQFKAAKKSPAQQTTIDLPASGLNDLYKFGLSRTVGGSSTQYLFHRLDSGYQEIGFRVIKKDDGHIILNNINAQETNTDDNHEYYALLHNAQRWIQDYAASLRIAPRALLELAGMDMKPWTRPKAAIEAGATALRGIGDIGWKITTVQKKKKNMNAFLFRRRRPRIAALVVAAALLPISAHEVAAEGAYHGVTGLFAADPGAALAKQREARLLLLKDKRFDNLGLQLPASSEIALGSVDAKIPYDGSLDLKIQNQAPQFPNHLSLGGIRRLESSQVGASYDNWEGLSKNKGDSGAYNCGFTIPLSLKGETAIRIVNTDPFSADGLAVSLSNRGLIICNVGGKDLDSGDLQDIYVQPVGH